MPIPSSVHIIENGIIIPPSASETETGFKSQPLNTTLRVPESMNVTIVRLTPLRYS